MRSVGLITEYNPFHNGHLHHLRESLRVTGAEVAVAVMSGHFLQRGEPALVDKWRRAEMALAAGVDVVVELPLPWACSSAPDFARGGVQALDLLGGIDTLCFGSEAGQIEPLKKGAEILLDWEQPVAKKTACLLRDGLNYPQARTRVLADVLPEGLHDSALAAPNNILGVEYLRALLLTGSAMQPFTIHRVGAGYHDERVGERGVASATGIRKRIGEGEPVECLLPQQVWPVLQAALGEGQIYLPGRYFQLLLGLILRDPAGLSDYWLVENGIENRLIAVAEWAADLEQLISNVKSRHLTRTRIQRTLTAILCGLRRDDAKALLDAGPQYLHLLGVSKKGEQFLALSRKQRSIPLIQNYSRIHSILKRFYASENTCQSLAQKQLDLELRATKIYTLLLKNWKGNHRAEDFFEPLRRS